MDLEKFMLPCLTKSIFGIDCPGCGLQRAVLLVAKGEFIAAYHMFPAIYTTLFLLIFLALHLLDKSRNYAQVVIGFAITNGAIMLISYIYKMTNF